MGGGDKRHVIPPMSKYGGDTFPPSPPGFTPLAKRTRREGEGDERGEVEEEEER